VAIQYAYLLQSLQLEQLGENLMQLYNQLQKNKKKLIKKQFGINKLKTDK
jgi:molybdenum-dependent DNA-binding transcriptional regulator ModE